MGTYIVKPTQLASSSGGWYLFGAATEVAAVFVAADGQEVRLPVGEDGLLRFSFTGDSFYLDGSGVPVSFAGLPAGFTPTSAHVIGEWVTNSAFAHFYLQQSALSEGPIDLADFPYAEVPTAINLWGNGLGIRAVGYDFAANPMRVDALRITGDYIIQSWWFNSSTLEYEYAEASPGAGWAAAANPPNIREESVIAEGASYAEALALATSILAARGKAEVSAKWKCRDENARPGRLQHIALPAPTSVFGDFKIQQVMISDFSMNPDLCPTFSVEAAPTRHSLEDILRMRLR